ncbi:MAG: hypothetical protein ACQETO_11485 [Pseudomonadota bacterium]
MAGYTVRQGALSRLWYRSMACLASVAERGSRWMLPVCRVDAAGRERTGLLCLLVRPAVRLRWLSEPAAHRTDFLDTLSLWIDEPRSRCRSLLFRNHEYFLLLENRRNSRLGARELDWRLRRMDWPGSAAWRRSIMADRRSRIMAVTHYGDYVLGLTRLACAEPPWRRRILLRLGQGSDNARANLREAYRQLGLVPPEIRSVETVDAVELRQHLRRGHCTLTTFCDLPPRFGVPVRVPFLGATARFCSGPAQLAVSAGVPVIPVSVRPGHESDTMLLGAAIDPARWQGLAYDEAVRAITTELAAHLEHRLREAPQYWRYLGMLPGYFQEPD